MTGVLLALAIACGETAPLIYTAGFSNTLPHSLLHAQFPYLTYIDLHLLPTRPRTSAHYLAYDAALDPGGDRPAPPGGHPDHRGPDPAPRRRGPAAPAARPQAAPGPGPARPAGRPGPGSGEPAPMTVGWRRPGRTEERESRRLQGWCRLTPYRW